MSVNSNGTPPPPNHAEGAKTPMQTDSKASESEDEKETIAPSVNDEDVNAAPPTTSEVTSPSVNTKDATTSNTYEATSPSVREEDTAASTTSEATCPSAQEDNLPENVEVHANFKELLEYFVTVHCREKYPSKKGKAILSEKEVSKFLKRAKVEHVASYNKKPILKRLQQSRKRVLLNTTSTPVRYNLRSRVGNSRLDQRKERRGGGVSVSAGVSGGGPVAAFATGGASYHWERENTRNTQEASEMGTEAEVTVKPRQNVGVEEIDTDIYYDAVGQFEFKVKNFYKIKYSLQTTKKDGVLTAVKNKVPWRRVAVKAIPGVKECCPVVEGSRVTANVGLVVFSGFVKYSERVGERAFTMHPHEWYYNVKIGIGSCIRLVG